MSDNTDYGFDLDSILAEFSSDSGTQDTEPPKPARPAAPAPATVRTEPKKTNAREFDPEFFRYGPETEKQQRPPKPAVRLSLIHI